MKVTVKLVGGFIHTVGFSEKELDLPPGTTVAALLAAIAIDTNRPMILARNGWVIRPDEEMRDGDRIVISPVFSGG
jgi:sulfur carrier protein ThiS